MADQNNGSDTPTGPDDVTMGQVLVQLAKAQVRLDNLAAIFTETRLEDQAAKRDINNKLSKLADALTQLTITSEKNLSGQQHLGNEVAEQRQEFIQFKQEEFYPTVHQVQTNTNEISGYKGRFIILGAIGLTLLSLAAGIALFVVQEIISATLQPINQNTSTQQEIFDQQNKLLISVDKILKSLQEDDDASNNSNTP